MTRCMYTFITRCSVDPIDVDWHNRFLRVFPKIRFQKAGLQLIFQLHGDKSMGMVSADVNRVPGKRKYTFQSLALDFADGERSAFLLVACGLTGS